MRVIMGKYLLYVFQDKTAKLQLEKKTIQSALDREIAGRDTEGDVKQLRGQLDIVMNKLKESKVNY